jgi:2-iminobutanoate/2-iminopropanoate deaminase
MSNKRIYEGPVKAAGAPYSPAVEVNGFIFISGQVPLDPVTREIAGRSIEEQTRAALENLRGVLDAAGCSPADVVKTTIFLRSMEHYGAVNAIYAEMFNTEPPARTAVAVAALPFGALIEIEAIAARR